MDGRRGLPEEGGARFLGVELVGFQRRAGCACCREGAPPRRVRNGDCRNDDAGTPSMPQGRGLALRVDCSRGAWLAVGTAGGGAWGLPEVWCGDDSAGFGFDLDGNSGSVGEWRDVERASAWVWAAGAAGEAVGKT